MYHQYTRIMSASRAPLDDHSLRFVSRSSYESRRIGAARRYGDDVRQCRSAIEQGSKHLCNEAQRSSAFVDFVFHKHVQLQGQLLHRVAHLLCGGFVAGSHFELVAARTFIV